LVRDGRKKIIRSRWRQDKGHSSEWESFVQSLQSSGEPPIPFDQVVASTLATLRLDESVATGKKLPVDCAAFLELAHRNSNLNAGQNE
jgi:hypothetical protein